MLRLIFAWGLCSSIAIATSAVAQIECIDFSSLPAGRYCTPIFWGGSNAPGCINDAAKPYQFQIAPTISVEGVEDDEPWIDVSKSPITGMTDISGDPAAAVYRFELNGKISSYDKLSITYFTEDNGKAWFSAFVGNSLRFFDLPPAPPGRQYTYEFPEDGTISVISIHGSGFHFNKICIRPNGTTSFTAGQLLEKLRETK